MCASPLSGDNSTLSINDEPFVAAMAALKSYRETFTLALRSLADTKAHVLNLGGARLIDWHVGATLVRAEVRNDQEPSSLRLFGPHADHQLQYWEGDPIPELLAVLCPELSELALGSVAGVRPLEEIVAAMMESLPSLELVGERLLALAVGERAQLEDIHDFRELVWRARGDWDGVSLDAEQWVDDEDDPNLAFAYDGSDEVRFTVFDEDGGEIATWPGEDARPLLTVGHEYR